jgi:hypothetical protein
MPYRVVLSLSFRGMSLGVVELRQCVCMLVQPRLDVGIEMNVDRRRGAPAGVRISS